MRFSGGNAAARLDNKFCLTGIFSLISQTKQMCSQALVLG